MHALQHICWNLLKQMDCESQVDALCVQAVRCKHAEEPQANDCFVGYSFRTMSMHITAAKMSCLTVLLGGTSSSIPPPKT